MVTKPEDWEFSDYRDWIGLREPRLANLELRNDNFRNGEDYRKSVEEFRNEKMKEDVFKYLMA